MHDKIALQPEYIAEIMQHRFNKQIELCRHHAKQGRHQLAENTAIGAANYLLVVTDLDNSLICTYQEILRRVQGEKLGCFNLGLMFENRVAGWIKRQKTGEAKNG